MVQHIQTLLESGVSLRIVDTNHRFAHLIHIMPQLLGMSKLVTIVDIDGGSNEKKHVPLYATIQL